MTELQEEITDLLESFITINILENSDFKLRLEIENNMDSVELRLVFNKDYYFVDNKLFLSISISSFRDMIEIKMNKFNIQKISDKKKYNYFQIGDYNYVVLKSAEEILPFIERRMESFQNTFYGWKW